MFGLKGERGTSFSQETGFVKPNFLDTDLLFNRPEYGSFVI
jgi:hypothetical protein